MGLMKQWLETISEEMGYEGEITEEVLAEGDKRLAVMSPPDEDVLED